MKYNLGIIGAGVMANAIIDSILKSGAMEPSEICVFDIDEKKRELLAKKGLGVLPGESEIIKYSNTVLFAVKPQHYLDICKRNDFSRLKNVFSIMAGVKIATLRNNLNGFKGGILRIMPNTPCMVQQGFCALCFDGVSPEDKAFAERIFGSCGDFIEITEDKFDAVTSVSGSGPAYVYMFAEGMIKGGMEGGLTYEEAKIMALATLKGAATLASISTEDLSILVDRVCSKGGTTIEAVKLYREKGLEDIISQGVIACKNRSVELGKL